MSAVSELASSLKEKKLSSSSLTAGDGSRPKTVTVKVDENKPKPTTKKNKPIQADLDVAKEFLRCRDEGSHRLDLSKANVSVFRTLLLCLSLILLSDASWLLGSAQMINLLVFFVLYFFPETSIGL